MYLWVHDTWNEFRKNFFFQCDEFTYAERFNPSLVEQPHNYESDGKTGAHTRLWSSNATRCHQWMPQRESTKWWCVSEYRGMECAGTILQEKKTFPLWRCENTGRFLQCASDGVARVGFSIPYVTIMIHDIYRKLPKVKRVPTPTTTISPTQFPLWAYGIFKNLGDLISTSPRTTK